MEVTLILIFFIVGIGAALFMAYMTGANDAANSVGPVVGAGALGLWRGLIMCAIFEFLGGTLIGRFVSATIRKGIVSPDDFTDQPLDFALGMACALVGGSVWLVIATAFSLPVSTTHSIVGGIIGFALFDRGFSALNYISLIQIVASWVASPVSGGITAFMMERFIIRTILHRGDPKKMAYAWGPFHVGMTVWTMIVFAIDSALKAADIPIQLWVTILLGFVGGCVAYMFTWIFLIPYYKGKDAAMTALFEQKALEAAERGELDNVDDEPRMQIMHRMDPSDDEFSENSAPEDDNEGGRGRDRVRVTRQKTARAALEGSDVEGRSSGEFVRRRSLSPEPPPSRARSQDRNFRRSEESREREMELNVVPPHKTTEEDKLRAEAEVDHILESVRHETGRGVERENRRSNSLARPSDHGIGAAIRSKSREVFRELKYGATVDDELEAISAENVGKSRYERSHSRLRIEEGAAFVVESVRRSLSVSHQDRLVAVPSTPDTSEEFSSDVSEGDARAVSKDDLLDPKMSQFTWNPFVLRKRRKEKRAYKNKLRKQVEEAAFDHEIKVLGRYGAVQIFFALQILAASFVAFGHAANNIPNSTGPLSGIMGVYVDGGVGKSFQLPFYVFVIACLTLDLGLLMFGRRVLMTVGEGIALMTPTAGYIAQLSTALTTIVCSRLGMPISTTHVLIGAVMGIGLAHRGLKGIRFGMVSKIVLSWVITVPASAIIAIMLFAPLQLSYS